MNCIGYRFLFCIALATGSLSVASELGPLDLKRLDDQTLFVVLGTVEKVEGTQIATISVSSFLRGSSDKEIFKLVLHVGNGIKDFDFPLKVGDKAIFFLKSLDGDYAKLAMHRSIALFKDDQIEEE